MVTKLMECTRMVVPQFFMAVQNLILSGITANINTILCIAKVICLSYVYMLVKAIFEHLPLGYRSILDIRCIMPFLLFLIWTLPYILAILPTSNPCLVLWEMIISTPFISGIALRHLTRIHLKRIPMIMTPVPLQTHHNFSSN